MENSHVASSDLPIQASTCQNYNLKTKSFISKSIAVCTNRIGKTTQNNPDREIFLPILPILPELCTLMVYEKQIEEWPDKTTIKLHKAVTTSIIARRLKVIESSGVDTSLYSKPIQFVGLLSPKLQNIEITTNKILKAAD